MTDALRKALEPLARLPLPEDRGVTPATTHIVDVDNIESHWVSRSEIRAARRALGWNQ